ncbi:MAG: glycosyltransferase [Ardenticatenaceae bacterium]|nr:glycosyltransferase [Ardenticatenaceae bacterium]
MEGNVTEEKLRSLYNQAMITVYSPIREPFGLVPIESMACGTPVVSVREGGTQETILRGKPACWSSARPAQFAQAIQRLWADREMVVE